MGVRRAGPDVQVGAAPERGRRGRAFTVLLGRGVTFSSFANQSSIYTWWCHEFLGLLLGSAGGSVVRNQPANAGDVRSIPGLGRSPGEGMGAHSTILA